MQIFYFDQKVQRGFPHAQTPADARVILLIDSSLGDVLAVTTVSVLLDFRTNSGPFVGGFLGRVTLKMMASVAAAILAGMLWSRVLPVLSEERFWQAVTFSVVLLLYASTEAFGHSGLLAVLAFGLTLANVRRIDPHLLGLFLPCSRPAKNTTLNYSPSTPKWLSWCARFSSCYLAWLLTSEA